MEDYEYPPLMLAGGGRMEVVAYRCQGCGALGHLPLPHPHSVSALDDCWSKVVTPLYAVAGNSPLPPRRVRQMMPDGSQTGWALPTDNDRTEGVNRG